MRKSSITIIAILVVLVIGAGAYLLFRPTSTNSSTTTTPSTVNPSPSTASPPPASQKAAATITYLDNGFSPAELTVKSGDTVVLSNTSTGDVQLESNPHPTHTDDTDLNVGLVATGQTKSFVVTKVGSFGYHNHLNPSQTGKITVQ